MPLSYLDWSGGKWDNLGTVWTLLGGKSIFNVTAATWQKPLLKCGISGRYQFYSKGPDDRDQD